MKNSLFLALLPIIGLGVYAAKVNPMSEAALVQANLPKVEKSKNKQKPPLASKRIKDAFIWPNILSSDHCPIGVDID